MMRSRLYEFASTVVPGTTCMAALMIGLGVPEGAKELSLPLQGIVFAVLSYAFGQVMQAVGKLVERVVLWRRGEPVTWLAHLPTSPGGKKNSKRDRLDDLLSRGQQDRLVASGHIGRVITAEEPDPHLAWERFLEHCSVCVRNAGRSARYDYLSSIYALCRGMVVAFAFLGVALLIKRTDVAAIACLASSIVLLDRVRALKVSSTRELLLQTLEHDTASAKPAQSPE